MLTAALAHWLHAQDLGVFGEAGADLFLQDLPATKEAAVGIFADAGQRAGRSRRPGVQLIVRAPIGEGRARPGYERAMGLLVALDGLARVEWGEGTTDAQRVSWVQALQAQPVPLGVDENNLPKWSVRFEVELPVDVGAARPDA